MRIIHSMGHLLGGSLLIAGTTIGVGMLAMPVATAPAGFVPSAFIYILCWLFMLATGLLIFEANLWMPKDTSFISMASKILGRPGKVIFWLMYLFLFLTLMVAHLDGGANIIHSIIGLPISHFTSAIIYAIVFAPVVYLGAHSVDRLNMILISGVILCYLTFIGVSVGSINTKLLSYAKWTQAWYALPILFTAFSYQVIIPTLVTYMKRNIPKIRLALFWGTLIPFVIYLIWEFLILGIIPVEGTNGLIEAGKLGKNAVEPLRHYVQSPIIFDIGKYFAFFALTTSFIPLALAFFDFLADGLKWHKKGTKRLILCLCVFGIPLVIALKYPQIFIVALGYAGGISCAFLFGLMPPLLVWVGRYIKKLPEASPQLPGGKAMLLLLIAFSFIVLIGEILQQVA